MTDDTARFADHASAPPPANERWSPVVIERAQIDAEIERLANLSHPPGGLREARIVHPQADSRGLGLAPGIEVRLSVLRPGEKTEPLRHNATEVNFCIAGSGRTQVAGREIEFEQYDVWNHPGWTSHVHHNPSRDLQVRLTYSNAAALRLLNVYQIDDSPPAPDRAIEQNQAVRKSAEEDPSEADALVNPFGSFTVGDGEAWLMPYERLINPPAIASPALYWPWREVVEQLDKLTALGSKYRGRRLYLLYNPMTGRTNGTTPSFFSTMTVRPPGIVDRPHRHVSAAINYYFSGSGFSRVDGERYDWSAGDLMFSAPGWAIHNHASNDDGPVYELTVQDQPFHIQLESLLWQENLKEPPLLLGVDSGFATNRGDLEK